MNGCSRLRNDVAPDILDTKKLQIYIIYIYNLDPIKVDLFLQIEMQSLGTL